MNRELPGKGNIACCDVHSCYYPTRHSDYGMWLLRHEGCSMPEWSTWDNRMETFERREGPVLHLVLKDEVPDHYTCELGDLELLAFAGFGGEE